MSKLLLFFLLLIGNSLYAKQYTFGMSHWVGFAPINVADAKGFWKDEKIDVKLINYSSGVDANTAFEQKRVDFIIDMLGNWVGLYNKGVNLKIIAEADWSHGGDKIIVKEGFDIAKAKKDKIGVYLNLPSVTFFLNKYLQGIGAKLSDYDLVEQEPTDLTKYFSENRLKLIVNYDPYAFEAVEKGKGKVAATSANFPGVIPEGIAVRKDVADTIPEEDLKKILRGWLKAVEWTKDPKNFDEYVKIINSKTFEGEKPYPLGEIKKMLESVKIHDKNELKKRNKDGVVTYVNEVKQFMKENNLIKRDFKPEDIVDNKVILSIL